MATAHAYRRTVPENLNLFAGSLLHFLGSRLKKALFACFTWVLYLCATLQLIRYYVVSTTFYLRMPLYLHGAERLPFQERVLPIYLMWPINHSAFLMGHLAHPQRGFDAPSAATRETLAFYLVSLVSFSLACYLVHRLYRAVTQTGLLAVLVVPAFMVLVLWTYVVHLDANFSYPYDMPSLAFFVGGLLAIYTRRFWPLAAVIFVGTFNRETTLFLIGIFILDAASRHVPEAVLKARAGRLTLSQRFSLRQVPWARAALLVVIWLAVKLPLAYHYRHNDNSENFVRLWSNIGRLRPRLWPALLNICGYILPVVVILRARLRPLRFANYLYILPVWVAVMFYTGVILETRVYGELCSFTAVAAVLLLEDYVVRRTQSRNYEQVFATTGERESPSESWTETVGR